jgi:glc operon protein GlcG
MAFPDYGTSITLAAARTCAAAAEAAAAKNGLQVVIAIVDTGGNLVLLQRMDNAHLGSIAIAEKKARTAVSLRRDTKYFENLIAQGGINMRMLGVEAIIPLEGGVVLLKDGKIIGAVGISGANAAEDGNIAAAAAAAV